jgi:hypothetical protein
MAACGLAGMAAIVAGYYIGEHTATSTSEFLWFWAGVLLLTLPLAWVVGRRASPRIIRTTSLILYGFVSYAPKLLRNPSSPLYHDELAHWRQTYGILSTGKLFTANPIIGIIAHYPGLHAATAALVRLTGLDIWHTATLLMLLFHVTLVLGIAELAQALGLNSRVASLLAILYGCNASFLYFDTQYSYESMAITLVVWTLVSFVRAVRSPSWQRRSAWMALTVVLSAGTVITHHLSALMLVVILALLSLALSVPWLAGSEQWITTAATAWGLTLSAILMLGAWLLFVAPATVSYLSPYMGQGFLQLVNLARGAGGGRQLFGHSLSPWWEQKTAYMVTVFAFALAVGGLLLIRKQIKNGRLPRGRRRALLLAFAAFGLLYFPSTLFIFSPSGAEGARRTWAFTWIGLCMLVGPAAVRLIDWVGRQPALWARIGMRTGLVSALAIAVVGGTAAGINAIYRFPGPFLYGSDARSITPELLTASHWFSTRFGADNNIVTDRYTGLIFASFGLQQTDTPSVRFPVYDLYLDKPGRPITPAYLLSELKNSHFTYLIVDRRMAYEVPALGAYFGTGEPPIPPSGRSPYKGRLGKFNRITWLTKIFQSDNYSIYRLNLPPSKTLPPSKNGHGHQLKKGHRHRPQPPPGKLLVTG